MPLEVLEWPLWTNAAPAAILALVKGDAPISFGAVSL